MELGKLQYFLEVVDNNSKKAFSKFEGSLNKLDKNIQKSSTKMSQNLSNVFKKNVVEGNKLQNTLKNLVGGFVGLAGAKKALDFTKESINSAVAFNQLNDSYNRLTQQAGINGDALLSKLREVSVGTVSNNDLITASNRALSLGAGRDIGEISSLLEIARLKGKAFGLSTTTAFNDIVTGIGRGSPLILDNLGITIKQGEAQEQLAEKLGKTTNALTEQEKKTALLEAVLKSGRAELEATGKQQLTTAERFQQISATAENARIAIGNSFIPTVEVLLDDIFGLSSALSANQAQQNAWAKTIYRVSNFVVTLGKLFNLIINVIVSFGDTMVSSAKIAFSVAKDIGRSFLNMGKNIKSTIKALSQAFRGDFDGALDTLKTSVYETFTSTAESFAEMNYKAKGWDAQFDDIMISLGESANRAIDLVDFQPVSDKNQPIFDKIERGVDGMADEIDKAGKKSEDAMKEMEQEIDESLAEAEEAIREFADANKKEQDRLQADIIKTNKAINDLKQGFKEANELAQEAFSDEATQIVLEATQQKAEIEKEIAELLSQVSDIGNDSELESEEKLKQQKILNESILDLRAELAKQEEVLNTNKEQGIVTAEQLEEAERKASLNPLEALRERYEAEKLLREEKFQEDILLLENQKVALEQSLIERQEEYDNFYALLKEQDTEFTTEFINQTKVRETATINSIDKLIGYYNKLALAKARAGAGGGGAGFKAGGLVGFSDGGYTGGAGADQVAGVVHGGEWVAPKWMVNSMPSLFNQLERSRTGGAGQISNDNKKIVNLSVTNNGSDQSDFWANMKKMRFMSNYI